MYAFYIFFTIIYFFQVRQLLDSLENECLDRFDIQLHEGQINFAFNAETVGEIINRLTSLKSIWGDKIVAELARMSPTSLKVTHRSLSLGGKLSLKNCLKMECNISNQFLKTSDFYEGVRALLLDKDSQPKWEPDSLDLVTPEIVNSYFIDSGRNLLPSFHDNIIN